MVILILLFWNCKTSAKLLEILFAWVSVSFKVENHRRCSHELGKDSGYSESRPIFPSALALANILSLQQLLIFSWRKQTSPMIKKKFLHPHDLACTPFKKWNLDLTISWLTCPDLSDIFLFLAGNSVSWETPQSRANWDSLSPYCTNDSFTFSLGWLSF